MKSVWGMLRARGMVVWKGAPTKLEERCSNLGEEHTRLFSKGVCACVWGGGGMV